MPDDASSPATETVIPAPRAPRRARPERRRGGRWGYAVLGVIVLLVIAFFVYRSITTAAQKPTYQTSAVTRGTLTVSVSGNGSAQTILAASVAPAVSGTVTRLLASSGEYVKKGQTLFVLDNPSLDQNVAQTKASYRQSQASVESAEQKVIQAESALADLQAKAAKNKTSVTEKQLDASQEDVDAACTGLTAAQASKKASLLSYQQAQQTAAQRTVKAPISGYVTSLNVQNGDQVGGGSTSRSGTAASSSSSSGSSSAPVIISDLSSLHAVVQIAETDRPKVKIGQRASVTFNALTDLTISGRVVSIDAVGTSAQNVVTYNVTIDFDVQDKRVSPAMTAAASIVTSVRPDVLLVPNAAVKTATDGSNYVQVLANANATPTNVTVTVGAAGDTQTEITSGVKEGDEVVTQVIQPGSTASTTNRTGSTGLRLFGGGGPGR